MQRRQLLLGAASAVTLGACSTTNDKFKSYSGPEVTYIVINKGARRMYLMHDDAVLQAYDINLGFSPEGHKTYEGDGRTPEGIYVINRRNPNSQFHLSLGISYPNARDVAAAEALGKRPGGDIFIHGQKDPRKSDPKDWTWGCVSVKNEEIEDIYAMVRDGTPIAINP